MLEDRILQLMQRCRTDELTGLGNYRAFREHVTMLRALGVPHVVVLFDMTNLKAANTELGHFRADELLRRMGQILRREDAAYRHGGDEFALVLVDCDDPDAVLRRVEAMFGVVRLPSGAPVRPVGVVARAELNAADQELERRKEKVKHELATA